MDRHLRDPLTDDLRTSAEDAELEELYSILERLPGERLQERARTLLSHLERREARLRAVVHDQAELVFRFHAGGRVTFVNPACCEYWQRSRVELLGRPVQSLLPSDGWQHLLRVARKLRPDEPVVQLEPRVLDAAGQPRIQSWTLRLIQAREDENAGNAVVGGAEYQVVARDVTELRQQQQLLAQHIAERRRIEAELRAEVQRLEALLAGVGGG